MAPVTLVRGWECCVPGLRIALEVRPTRGSLTHRTVGIHAKTRRQLLRRPEVMQPWHTPVGLDVEHNAAS